MGRKQKTTSQILTSNPIPTESQKISRVLGGRGKNLHEVQFPDGTITLCSLPPKFRNLVWVKRGSYVIISPSESENSSKIGGDIVHVLFPEHIKYLKSEGIWLVKSLIVYEDFRDDTILL
ncbi:2480_t:CDS:2 [Acaulospora colombiana]|uniref:2480_t:CDS:1 n=1 Tax=Acaulospora colombiana TaxID=27376 RepID=A0ACA9K6H9_9GLOM|nr:2480_t:CDS:2 [Acaulospora colombiana]